MGAVPVTCVEDMLNILGITAKTKKAATPASDDPYEQLILNGLSAGVSDASELLAHTIRRAVTRH